MNFCLIFTLYIGFHSFVFSLYSAEENEQTSAVAVSAAASLPPPQKLMGIEIETSCIKIDSPTSSKIGFYFKRPSDGKCLWILEEDTLDPTFSASAELERFDQNVEIKTHEGFTFTAINEVIADMEDVISFLYERAFHTPFEAHPKGLEEIQNHKYRVTPKWSAQTQFLIKSKEIPLNKLTIKPQITYQLPLQDISRVFERLKKLEHSGISYLLRDLSDAPFFVTDSQTITTKLKGSRLQGLFTKLIQNKDTGERIRQYFHDFIAPQFAALPEGELKGFTLLFLHYWYELFNNKQAIGIEPGLKQYVGIKSRIPFSQLYDGLEEHEKPAFQVFMSPHLSFGHQCNLRSYLNNDELMVDGTITLTLTQWYESIVNESHRQTVGLRRVDLVSPPPSLIGHSMGILDINSHANGFALIEVRGYSELKYGRENLTIHRIREFGVGESVWFFEILRGRKR
jgi:hypothetical protein